MQCFDTFRGFLHKIHAATIDGKGRVGTYNFFHDGWGQSGERGGRAWGTEGKLPPLPPARGKHSTT